MKKLHTLLFGTLMALCLVSFASCSDDDDDISKSDLVGKWYESAVSCELDCEPKSVKDAIIAYYKDDIDTNILIEFDNDNKYWEIELNDNGTEREGDRDLLGTYVIKGDKVYLSNIPNEEDDIVAKVIVATLKNGQLSTSYDGTKDLEYNTASDYFWKGVGVEKPANFKVNKYIETTIAKKK